jgi:hypothetical protein
MPAAESWFSRKGEQNMRSVLALACGLTLLLSVHSAQAPAQSEAMSVPVVAQTVAPLATFSSVEMRGGGKAILRHGPAQRVTLLKGSPHYTSVTIAPGSHLDIEKCKRKCPRGYDLEIEIVTPVIARISVANGSTMQSRGGFPRQAEIGVAVSNGGTIDIRSMAVERVTASVDQGGRIFTIPQVALFASVMDGGNITYWGDARVQRSVQHGGVVTQGTAAEADKPLSELSPPHPSTPPIPELPPIHMSRNHR